MSDECPEGIEERLRSSLRAYAELVDAPEGDELPARSGTPATPRAAIRRWRGAVLAAAAAAAVVTGSVWLVTGDGSEHVAATSAGSAESGAEGSAELPESDTWAAAGVPNGAVSSSAGPASPEVGVAYPLDLFTHCGVFGTDIGGVWFAADPPLVEGAGNPPPGWDNPYQRGTVTLLTADEAVFADDAGHEVRLRAADDSARPGPCD
jgi:hypothetical protein